MNTCILHPTSVYIHIKEVNGHSSTFEGRHAERRLKDLRWLLGHCHEINVGTLNEYNLRSCLANFDEIITKLSLASKCRKRTRWVVYLYHVKRQFTYQQQSGSHDLARPWLV
ncbi:hypothetical protein MPTK1_4g06520 [Marchantia polymorpha subsp. ruderalis]|uniref:Uncharacterized protein n=2 Tax=Marchantia polymorpha TaxID=3197 RepID=A0AAF6B723_MARPO|nr:hypothetical protein MARPO_0114s0010 [Marchantia polymorpha]BBN07807.1 hypothetical protein Mp_4g06520 [Marchantia polymorpha subsp. ruderalis]|eukprot:PTQ31189.1 hypothetical protein MARPO_0114s0010 [Marchantia polymorpha]